MEDIFLSCDPNQECTAPQTLVLIETVRNHATCRVHMEGDAAMERFCYTDAIDFPAVSILHQLDNVSRQASRIRSASITAIDALWSVCRNDRQVRPDISNLDPSCRRNLAKV